VGYFHPLKVKEGLPQEPHRSRRPSASTKKLNLGRRTCSLGQDCRTSRGQAPLRLDSLPLRIWGLSILFGRMG
jgi:hypothetical protein